MKRIKRPPLSQYTIDHGLPPVSRRSASWRETLSYLNASPGGLLTTIVALAIFAVAMWGVWYFWNASNAVITAIKG